MKRFLQILMLAAALAVPWVTQAQQSLTVHDGTATNEYVPMYDYYADTRGCESQFIYPASDLASVPVGNVITQLEFYTQTVAGNTNATYVVKIGETSQSTYSSATFISRDDLATVYTGTMPSKASNSSIAIVLDNEYVYQGGNLVIDIFVETAGSYKHNFFYGEAASGSSLNRQSSTGTINQKDFLPKTTFTYAVPPSCPKPTGVAASNVSATGATVGWTPAAASQNNFVVAYGTGTDPDQMATVTATTSSAALTGLTANTTYNVYVKAVCSATDQSAWSQMASFRTLVDCGAGYAYRAGVIGEGTSSSYYPLGYAYGTTSASYANGISGIIYTADDLESMNLYNNNLLHGIKVHAAGSGSMDMTIFVANTSKASIASSSDTFTYADMTQVFNGTASFVSGEWTALMFDQPFVYDASSNLAVVIRRNALIGTSIPIYYTSTSPDYCTYYDYKSATTASFGTITRTYNRPNMGFVFCTQMPSCPSVNSVVADNITSTSVDIAWQLDDETQNNFVVAYGTGTDPDQMATVSATTNSAVLAGLAANTTYNVYVKAVCGATDQSAWSSAGTFTTLCAPFAVPYTENFDSYAASTTPDCWTKIGPGTAVSAANTGTTYSHSGSMSLKFSQASAPNSNTIALPQFTAPTNTLELTLWTRPESFTSNNCGQFDVGYMTDPTDADSFVALATYNYDEFSDVEERIVNYSNAPANAAIALRHRANSNAYYWFVDDIDVHLIPSCPKPDIASASAIDAHSGLVQWTPAMPDQNNFVVAYGLGTDPSTMTTISATGTSAVISGLSALTKYNVFVKAVCGTGDESLWSTVASFSTPVGCGTGYELKDFTLGDGTSSSSAYAFYASTSYPFGYGAPIFTAEEVGANNLYENNTINAIRLHVGTTGGTINNAHIYMANVAIDNYTGASDTALFAGMTEVYSGTLDCPANQWITIPLTTPFAYDVNSNLMIRFAHSSTASAGVSFFYTNMTPNYYNIYGYRSSTGATASATKSYYRPNVEFMVCSEVPSCFPVQSVTASNVNTTNANISWTLNDATQNSFTVAYGTTNDVAAMATATVSNTNVTLYGLTPNTTYYATVRANCDSEDVSSWYRTISFHTPCDVADSAIFFENFDSYTDNAIPDCWEMGWWYQNPTSGVKAQPFITSTTQKFGGSGRSMSLQDQGAGTYSYLSTQCLPIDRANKYSVSLQVYRPSASSYAHEGIKIWASPSKDDTTNATLLGYIHRSYTLSPVESATGWYQYEFAIPQSGNQYILIEGVSDYGAATYFDNLEVKLTPCLKNIPYTNDFESAEVDMIPLCWDNSASTSSTLNSNPQYLWGVYNYNGNNMIRMYNYLVGPGNASINTNPFILPDTVCELKLDISNHANCPAAEILISNDGGNTFNMLDMVSATASSTSYSDPGTFVPKAYSLAGYAGDTVIFRFRTNANYGNGAIFIDNIQIRPVNSCIEPADVTAATVSTTSVAVSWTAGDATQNTFAVAYGTGNDPETMDTIIVSDTNTAVISGLTFEQNYNFYVKAICDETHSSYWSNSASAFLGYCSPAPTSVDNQGITNVSFGNGDETVNNSQRLTSNPFYGDFSSMIGGVTAADMANVDITYSTNYTYGTIIWVDWNNNLVFDGNEVVYAGEASATAPTVLNASFLIPVTQDTGYYRIRIAGADSYYDNYTSSIEAAANANPCPTGSYTIVHDYTLHVLPAPSCLKPTNVVASNITDNSADIAWSSLDTTQNNFVVAYGTGLNPDEMTTVTATGNSMTFTGLTNATTYNVFVKAICSSDDESEWSNVCTFNTNTCGVENQCPVYISMADAYGDGWNGGALAVVDAADNTLMATFALDDYDFGTDSVFICKGRSYNLVWSAGPYDEEVSFILTGATGDTIYEVGEPDPGFLTTFTGSCPITDSSVYVVFAVNDTTMGVTTPATGEYTYRIGDIVTATATANPGYEFINWNVNVYGLGDTVIVGNPYTDTFPGLYAGMNVTITANFQVGTFDVTVLSNDNSLGVVAGSGSYSNGDTAILIATPAPNCHFVQWNDGDTNATRQVVVTADATYTATFALDQYALTVLANDTTMGTVTGAGSYNYGDTATLTATANTGYHFVSWNDGDTNATRVVTVTADASYTATFAINQYTLTVAANDAAMGTVTGAGSYDYNSTATLTATANTGYHFVSWNDGDTNATRVVTVTADASYTATFAINQYTLTVVANDAAMGTVTGAGLYNYNSTATLTATANTGYHFVAWNDGDTNATRVVTVTADASYTATFAINQYTLTVAANDATMGTVTGAGIYNYGDTATLAATANNGYMFVGWNDDNTDNPRTIIVTADASYTATFAVDPCYNITLPFVEGFETDSPNLACWTSIGDNSWTVGTGDYSASTGAHSGTMNAKIAHLVNGNQTKLVTPVLNAAGVNSVDLSFWYVNRSWSGDIDYLTVYYRTDPASDTWTQLGQQITDAHSTWTNAEYTIPLNGASTVQVAFECYDNYGYGIGIDDVTISATPSCVRPANVLVSNVGAASATISWTPADASQNNFVVAYGTGTNPDSMATVNAATASATLTGLNSNTAYNVFVKAVCSATDQSAWSNMATFRTMVDCGTGYAYREGVIGTGTSSSYNIFGYAYGTTSASYAQGISASIYTAAEMQAFSLYSNNLLQGIKVHAAGTGSMDMTIFVANTGKASIANTLDTFVYDSMAMVFNGTASFVGEEWASLMFDQPFAYDADSNLAVVIRRNSPIATSIPVHYTSTSPNYYGYYDYKSATAASFGSNTRTYNRPNMGFVFCVEMPGCPTVNNVAASNITSTSADIAWQIDDTTQNSFVVAYGTGTNPDSMTAVNAATTSASLTGLTPATTYNVFVKALCSATDQSDWSNMTTFSTPAIPATVPYLCDFEDAAENSTWLTVAGSGTNHFVIGSDTNAVCGGANALYVADANGAYTYANSSATQTFAYRPIQLAAGTYAVDFDWTCTGGESTWDFGSVMIVPLDEALVGGAGVGFNNTVWPDYIKRCEPADKQFFNLTPGKNSYSGSFTVTEAGIYNIAVMWSNDGSVGTSNYPLAIDNFSIRNAYTLTVAANNDTMGTVTGSGVYAAGDTATMTATANTGYRFVNWNDGDTSSIRTIVMNADASYTAIFSDNSQFAVTVMANDDAMGTVTGSGLYAAGDTATLTATANTGYHFVNWNDNDTHAVRTIVVTADATYTANFAADQFVITVAANDTAMGSVTGAGLYYYNDTVTLTATANTGYHFVSWNDGDTNASRTVVVTADASYTATFAINQYILTVVANDATMGSVTGSGLYNYNSTATLTAVANTGYHFVNWNDNDTNATRQVVVTSDATYTATFAQDVVIPEDSLVVMLAVNNSAMGTTNPAAGTYVFHAGDTARAEAIPAAGYHFVNWTVTGLTTPITDNPVVMVVDSTMLNMTVTVTANFAQDGVIPEDSLVVTLAVNNSAMGTTNPAAGTYVFHAGDTARAEAIPAAGYHFVNWTVTVTGLNTPITDNPVMMVVDSTMLNMTVTVTANFAQDSVIPATYTITLDVNDTTMGYVTGAGEYAEGATAVISAVAYEGYHFVSWNDGDLNAIRTITVGCDLSFTAIFAADSTATLVVVVDETMGYVLINGESVTDNMYQGMLGDTVTIEAVANAGYHFVSWNDGDTHAVRTVVLDSAVVRLAAEFAQNVSIDDVETVEPTIYTVNNRIVVRGAEQQPVYVFDVVGRLVAKTDAASVEQSFTMSHSGIYLVKVANSAAKRVVVR